MLTPGVLAPAPEALFVTVMKPALNIGFGRQRNTNIFPDETDGMRECCKGIAFAAAWAALFGYFHKAGPG